ncbi:MAG: phenylacetate--CoA ligase family protein [Verrucomicrobiaceae bacterium]|nr:MAG: phenylacetate--CoA ligase family protein [Verrucomicrobiaceae bacterium]
MPAATSDRVPRSDTIDRLRHSIRRRQWEMLRALLDTVLNTNPFHRRRLDSIPLHTLEEFLKNCPLMSKRMLVHDREAFPPYGSNQTYPLENYTRFCQTSGTTGPPLTWLDSRDDWEAMLSSWQHIFSEFGVIPGEDRVFFPFSFGPFLGFWTAFEAASRVGCLVIPGGGMSSNARLQLMLDHEVTIACTTPTYALHLGEMRQQHPAMLEKSWALRAFVVAGEPGGSQPGVLARLEELWPGVKILDHHGLTETGPVSYVDPVHPNRLRVMEDVHFAEILDPASGVEVLEGGTGELVLTTLHRLGCPMLRYRTGDLVKKVYADDGGLCLDGGILGRLDDMIAVRGVNIYPTAVDAVLRRFPEIVEYQVREMRHGALLDLKVIVETAATGPRDPLLIAERVSVALRDTFQLRMDVEAVPQGTLPRFEFKARRWIKEIR